MAGRPLSRSNEGALIAQLERRIEALERRRPVAGQYEIKLFGDDEPVTVGIPFIFGVPFNLTKAKLRYINTYVTTVSSSGKPTVQITNLGHASDPAGGTPDYTMLSTPLSIDVGEKDAETAAVQWEIKGMEPPSLGGPSYAHYGFPYTDNTVFFKQQLAIEVTIAGTGAMGLGIQLGFDG